MSNKKILINEKTTYHRVLLTNLHVPFTVDEFPIPRKLEGKVRTDGSNLSWYIEKAGISYEDLIDLLMVEFDYFYLILAPDKKIIVDFKLCTDAYEDTI